MKINSLYLFVALAFLSTLFTNCNNVAPADITVLQVHLEDNLSIQAGLYDTVRIDLTDKDGKIWKEKVFFGPYDKDKDKKKLENIEVTSDAPTPIRVVISAYKGKVKQAEFVFQVAADKIAKSEPSTFIPPNIKEDSIPKVDTIVVPPNDSIKPQDTTKVPNPGRLSFSTKDFELYAGGDSVEFSVVTQPSDSGKEVTFQSSDEEVFIVTGDGRLFPKKAGQAVLIAFLTGFPATGDTAKVKVIKDSPIINAGIDRRVPLDSSVSFPIKISQKHGSVKSLKWDLDGDGKYEDSASKSDTTLYHTFKTKGDFTLSFYARDSEGNDTTASIKVQAGILSPFVVITKPGRDTTVNTTPFVVEYQVDGAPKTKSVPLQSGKTLVPISETNQYGVGADTVSITLDMLAPGKPVFSSQTPAFSKNRRPTWVWTQNPTDKGNGTFKIQLAGIGDPIFTTDLSFKPAIDLVDGAHVLQVQERDAAGNWSDPVSQSIYVDQTKPTVIIESPSAQAIFRTGQSSVILSGTAMDAGGISTVTYTMGSTTANATGIDEWKTAGIIILDNKTTTIVVSVEDKAGNIGLDTIRIQGDMRGPGVTITQPSAIGSFFTTTGTLNIKGTATDSSSIKNVKYILAGATTGEGDATGTTNWEIPALYLLPGITQILVVAYDSLLNSGILALDIAYKPGVCLVNASAKGKNTGTNWEDAYPDLQSALASGLLGELWVAKGTYKPTSGTERSISFVTQASLHMYGGFKGTETTREQRDLANNTTILSGDIGSSVATDNSYHVVRAASNVTLDGFTITGGYADEALTEDGKGAGVYVNGFSPNFVNCIVKNHYSASNGAGIFINNGLSQIINCIFADNESGSGGGLSTAGNSSPVVLNSLFIRNKGNGVGGGIVINSTSVMTVKNTLFAENNSAYGRNIAMAGSLTLQYTNADTTWVGGVMNLEGGNPTFFTGNAHFEPIFMGPSDYRLQPGSPGIDAGGDGVEVPKFDIIGGLRPKGRGMDLGPYEQ